MRTRAFTYAAAAAVLSVVLTACSSSSSSSGSDSGGSGLSGTKVNADIPGPAGMSCDDPNIPMAEWRKRCATASPTGTPSAPKTAAVGDTVTVTMTDAHAGTTFDATLVRVVDPAPPENPANPNTYPKNGNRFVAIQWKITNTGPEQLTSNQIYSTHIVDDHGEWHLSALAHVAAGPSFPYEVRIPPGESRLAFLVYELPQAAKATTVQFDGDYAKPVSVWKLS